MDAETLKRNLGHFTGSTQYAKLYAHLFLTDGAVYLAENAGAWWLLDVFASYLLHINGNQEAFTCLKMTVADNTAMVVIEDGNDKIIVKQHIEYTDFPLAEITLYGCWSEDVWVVMLPSEY